jgi:hypothetical protein
MVKIQKQAQNRGHSEQKPSLAAGLIFCVFF